MHITFPDPKNAAMKQPLAIVGIGCRLPGGVRGAESFWDILASGRTGIVETPADRWNLDRYYHPDTSIPGKVVTRWGGFVEHLDQFDAQFWRISPREAMRMDPQQRWLLEVAWDTIEDAQLPPRKLAGKTTGVFVGISSNDYAAIQMSNHAQTDVHTNSGCTLSIAANRISYALDFKGPSVSVDTACSSSLVAVALACQSIWAGDCDVAMAAGVNALIIPHGTVGFSKASMLSPDGRCFAFDARANGYVRGEGTGAVLLRPLDQTIADKSRIYAVIRAAVVNQDGHTSAMTVPSLDGQIGLLRQAYQDAGIDPAQVSYVEAHGTGTPVGDPIEAAALGKVLSEGRSADESCLIGSVKTNIGHLEAASGIAGLIKAALVLDKDTIPPSLNYQTPNPQIPFDRLKLEVVTKLRELPHPNGRLPVAAVNSFGFGGTNAHVVLEAVPIPRKAPRAMPIEAERPCLLPISAHNDSSLRSYVEAYRDLLGEGAHGLRDVCGAAGERKEHLGTRLTAVGRSAEEMCGRLDAWLQGQSRVEGIVSGRAADQADRIVFVFTGQGVQWWGMARELLASEPSFRRTVERIDDHFEPLAGWSLIEQMTCLEEDSKIDRTDVGQPLIFALQTGLVELWKSWGVEPDKVIGHSVGEVAAAHCAGICSLPNAVRIIYHRSRLQETTRGRGGMLTLGIPSTQVRRAISAHSAQVHLAAINAPELVTLAGDIPALKEIAAVFEAAGTFTRWLPIDYAFHTHQMDPIQDELLSALADITPTRGHIAFVSTVTAGVLQGEALDSLYWWHNVRDPVLFAPALSKLIQDGADLFLEIGSHPALESSIRQCLVERDKKGTVLHSLRRDRGESQEMLANLAGLFVHGVDLGWAKINQSSGAGVRLPPYPWSHESFWLESDEAARQRLEAEAHPLLGFRTRAVKPTWQLALDPRLLPYLNDHRFWNSVVFPAAGYAEIGLAVARQLFPDEPYAVEELDIKKALFVSAQRVPTVQTVFDPVDKTFRIYSVSGRDQDWEQNAKGRLTLLPSDQPSSLDVAQLKRSLAQELDRQQYYDDFASAGYQFGPDFQHTQRLHKRDGEALAEISISRNQLQNMDRYHIHPAVLDACIQTFRGILQIPEGASSKDYFYLPQHIRRVQLYRDPPPRDLWAHATRLSDDGRSVLSDIHLYDGQGTRVADVLGLRADRIDQSDSSDDLESCYYQLVWEPGETAEADRDARREQAEAPRDAGTFLVLVDEGGIGDALCARFESGGDRVVRIRRGAEFRVGDGKELKLSPDCEDDWRHALLTAMEGGPLAGIVHCWSLDHPEGGALTPDLLLSAQSTGVLSARKLVRALNEVEFDSPPQVTFVTRDVQAVLDRDQSTGLVSSPLVGLVRVASNEYPNYRWSMIDLDREQSPDEIENLAMEIKGGQDEVEVAYRHGRRYASQLRQVHSDDLPRATRNAVQPDGSRVPYRLQADRPGVLASLTLRETQRREPGPDDVEVRVKAGGINFRDAMKAVGVYPGNPIDLLWFGDDFCGAVERVGANVPHLKAGDVVAGMSPYCFRAYTTVDHRMVFAKPSQMSVEDAATLPTVFLTAYYAIVHLARMRPGEKILIHAAAGGVGQAAVQIAERLGLEIFATAGTPDKRRLLRERGLSRVMDSRSLAFADQIMEITGGQGVDAVLNSLAGDFITKSLSVLAPFGRFLELGKIDVYNNAPIGLEALKDNISYFVIDLAQCLEKQPQFVASMLADLAERFEAGDYRALPHTVFSITEVVEAFRHVAQSKHVGKNVLSFEASEIPIGPVTEEEYLLRPDATYLITGGTSGFGLALAKWMAEHGARHLVLLSRSGPAAEAAQDLERLRAAGAEVLELRCDVTEPDDVERVVDRVRHEMPPLRGVIHGAMVLDDEFLADLDDVRFDRALHPKMLGAWNLHAATITSQLEHFICFSSFSAVIGGPRQSNYNAGNYFLGALAHYRRALGLPALTFNWGVLSGTGFVERNPKTAEYLNRIGAKALTIDEALRVFRSMLVRDPVEISAFRADWSTFRSLLPGLARGGRFAAVASDRSQGQGGGSIRRRVLGAAPEQRPALLEGFVLEQVAAVVSMDPAGLDRDTPLGLLGVDSLMTVELIQLVKDKLGVTLATASVIRGPTVRELAQTILQVLAEAEERAEPAAGASAASTAEVARLERTDRWTDEFPLSMAQRKLWHQDRLAPGSSANNLTLGVKIRPALDFDIIRETTARVFQRHPMLDVTFADVRGEEPVQRLHRGRSIDFREHDVRGFSKAQIDAALQEHATRPFNLETDPVVRLELFRGEEDAHIALFCMHHIASDAWSVALLFHDLLETYFLLKDGKYPQYLPQPFSYRDFVAWERTHLESDAGRRMLGFWKKELAGAPMELDLPTDHPRRPGRTSNGATHGLKLDAQLTQQVIALSAEQKVTLFTTLLSAFEILFHRYTGQQDMLVGCPFAGRPHHELEGVIGYFASPVALRSRIDDEITCLEFIDRNSAHVSEAIDNQYYPAERLVDELDVPQDPSRNPMFQISFSMERVPRLDAQWVAVLLVGQGGHRNYIRDMTAESIDLTLRQAPFEITLVAADAGDKIYGCWQYNGDLFEPHTIARLSDLYVQVLSEIVRNPLQRISAIVLSSE